MDPHPPPPSAPGGLNAGDGREDPPGPAGFGSGALAAQLAGARSPQRLQTGLPPPHLCSQ